MPTIEQQPNYLSYTYPTTPSNFINPSNFNIFNYATPATMSAPTSLIPSPQIAITTSPLLQPPVQQVNTIYTTQRFTNQTNAYQQYIKNNKPDIYYPKSKRSGHVSKNHRVNTKRATIDQINLQKSCPNCSKYWRNCKCSNIKNRPDPKPYCKFVPPRMLRKLVNNASNHEN